MFHLLFGAQDQRLGAEKDQLPCEPTQITRWKLAWFWHVMHCDSLSKTILQGTLEGGHSYR